MPRDWTSFRHSSTASHTVWYASQGNGTVNNTTVTSGTLSLVPFFPGAGGTVVRASVFPTTAGANRYLRGAIYQNRGAADFFPGAFLVDVGCFSIQSAGFIGLQTNSINLTLDQSALYWLVSFMSSGVAGGVLGSPTIWPINGAEPPLASPAGAYTATNTLALWPATFPANTTVTPNASNPVHFWLEVDSQ